MREFARSLYKSKAWKKVREFVIERDKGLCQRCKREGRLTAGKIVHHKIPLTPANINDTRISLNPDNLEYVCKECHEITHEELEQGVFGLRRKNDARVAFDSEGNVVEL